jgi:hypothetical protein
MRFALTGTDAKLQQAFPKRKLRRYILAEDQSEIAGMEDEEDPPAASG